MQEPYQQQWDSLNLAITQLIRFIDPAVKGSSQKITTPTPTMKAILQILRNLRNFATFQLEFIEDTDASRPNPPQSDNDVRELDIGRAYATTLKQIGADLDTLSRCAMQRLVPEYAKRLQDADRVASALLQRAKDAGLCSPNAQVITYFNKNEMVRVVPYADVALIGVPWEITASKQQPNNQWSPLNHLHLLAIAHELGHFIFWNERLSGTSDSRGYQLPSALANAKGNGADRLPIYLKVKQFQDGGKTPHPRKFRKWIEETCADIIGCWLIGPYIAKDFLDLSSQRFDDSNLTVDDGEHPSPFIRPDVYLQTLSVLAQNGYPAQWQKWQKALKKEWNGKLADWLSPDDLTKRTTLLDEARPIWESLIAEILKGLSKAKQLLPCPNHTAQSDSAVLYERWDNWVEGLLEDKTKFVITVKPNYDEFSEVGWKEWQSDLLSLYEQIKDLSPKCDVCRPIKRLQITVYAGGWTEGPCCTPKLKRT